jgi:transposase
MGVVGPCCCGLDVHAKPVVACLIKQGKQRIQAFSTMTEDLLKLGDWLRQEEGTPVAMESSGVYWEPVCNLLEGALGVSGQRAAYQRSAGA